MFALTFLESTQQAVRTARMLPTATLRRCLSHNKTVTPAPRLTVDPTKLGTTVVDYTSVIPIQSTENGHFISNLVKRYFGDKRVAGRLTHRNVGPESYNPPIEFCWSRSIQAMHGRPLSVYEHHQIDHLWAKLKAYAETDAQDPDSGKLQREVVQHMANLGIAPYKQYLEELYPDGFDTYCLDQQQTIIDQELKTRGGLMLTQGLHTLYVAGTLRANGEVYLITHDPHNGQSELILEGLCKVILKQSDKDISHPDLAQHICHYFVPESHYDNSFPQILEICQKLMPEEDDLNVENLQKVIRATLLQAEHSTIPPTLWKLQDLIDEEPQAASSRVLHGPFYQVLCPTAPHVTTTTRELPKYMGVNQYFEGWESSRGLDELLGASEMPNASHEGRTPPQ